MNVLIEKKKKKGKFIMEFKIAIEPNVILKLINL